MALHWGIASAGKISHDFVSALASLPKTDHQVVCVGARSVASAENFAKTHGIPRAYEGYLKIAEDKEVDIVYVGSIHPQHFEISKLMLENGKHVLCEKPLTMSEKQTRKLIEIAKNNKTLLVEGIWSRSFPVYQQLRKILDSGAIGDVVHVDVSFGSHLENVDRVQIKELGGGAILDLGVYALQFQQFVFRGLTPDSVIGTGSLNEHGSDIDATAILSYPGGKIAQVATCAKASLVNEGFIVGTKGIIRIPNFWCPTKLITPEKTYEFELPKTTGTFNFNNSVGLSYQAEHARQLIKAGKLESPNITHEESIQLAHLMDTWRKLAGVVISEDSE